MRSLTIALGLALISIPGAATFAQSPNLCGYPNQSTGTVTAPSESFVSPSFTASNGSPITVSACMAGPSNLNYDLLLYKSFGGVGGGGWLQIGTGTSTGPNQRSLTISDTNGPTNYILKIRPNGGTGSYTASWRACSVPSFSPAFWNSNGNIQGTNNCYNYATNRRTDTFAQPGRASGAWCNSAVSSACFEATTMATYTANDGLTPGTAGSPCAGGMDKLALVIWPGVDFHFYRQDANGKWSHKPGSTPAKNTDNSGAQISNPETANRGNYSVFAGYFCTCSNGNQGAGSANIN